MQHYLFVFGRDPQLSILELVSYLDARDIEYELQEYDDEVAYLKAKPFSIKNAIKELGGTQKIGVLTDLNSLTFTQRELKYHIEYYGESDEDAFKKELKQVFKLEKLKPIYKNIQGPQDLDKHQIIQEGYEFLVYNDLVFKTVHVSNPASYKERDKKPFFDEKRTISVRLARMLINISGVVPGNTLLDPYCGTGTILQEALMLGVHVVGLDNDKMTCEGCVKNMYWIRKTYSTTATWNIYNKDARRLGTYVDKADAIVTEPYLGPFLRKLPTYKQAQVLIEELEKDYAQLLKQLKMVSKGRIVLIVPYYKANDGRIVKMDFSELVKKAGLKIVKPVKGIEVPVKYLGINSKIQREVWIME